MANLATLEKRVNVLAAQQAMQAQQHVQMHNDGQSFTILHADQTQQRTYKPCKTAQIYHASDDFIRLIMGPFGSGKSTASIAEIVMRAIQMPRCIDGVRRSKWAVIRNTSGELETSTLATWLTWFDNLGDVHTRKKPVLSVDHVFNDGQGRIELQVVFLALDRPEQFKKLKSTEFTGAYLNEANELPEGIFDFIKGRINGRYPSKVMCTQSYWTGIIADTNPPDNEHWIYKMFEEQQPVGYRIFKQPPGLIQDEKNENVYNANPEADNAQNLAPDYYTKMAVGASKEFIKVYCMGQYGLVQRGIPVYQHEYNDDLHSIEHIALEPGYPIKLGFDFGSTPACLIAQTINGQLRAVKEFVSNFNTSMRDFLLVKVKPWLDQHALNYEIEAVYDPANPRGQGLGIAPSQVINKELQLVASPAPTNDIQPRLDAVKYFLTNMFNGKPAFIVSRSGCPQLRSGFYGKYQYKTVFVYGENRPKEVPDKTHPISDIHDACQYIALQAHYTQTPVEQDDEWQYQDVISLNDRPRAFA